MNYKPERKRESKLLELLESDDEVMSEQEHRETSKCQYFGDLAEVFLDRVVHLGRPYARVDILFDRYRPKSIKSGSRCRRTRRAAPVRRDITSAAIPLPKDWKNFLALGENKAELARFLSQEVVQHIFEAIEVVFSGGLIHEDDVRSTNTESDVSAFAATHEEADKRVLLYAVHSDVDNIVVMARDTDICLLLIHHSDKMTSSKVWMMSDTAKKRKYLSVHEICKILPNAQKKNILAFHAVTGCDSTSDLATITKKAAWKVSNGMACQLLDNLGHSPLTPSSKANAEKFLVQLYKVAKDLSNGDQARHQLFGVKEPEALPPTNNAQCAATTPLKMPLLDPNIVCFDKKRKKKNKKPPQCGTSEHTLGNRDC
ncbi:unnamed protein product [Ceutorhynchus assimilis]|uniref:Uncharacterized protein n=1 Tax=Ceutorhynchus assimilis TaxID=467358 RepID=A0A9N9MHK6_9CUCU|nr:unnamed protein product [Ceutorhynchus assimilis]